MPVFNRKKKLTDIIREAGLLDENKFKEALEKQAHSDTKKELKDILVSDYGVSEEEFTKNCLSKFYEVEYLDLKSLYVKIDLLNLLPREMAERYGVFPVKLEGDNLTLAMVNPQNIIAIDDIAIKTKKKLKCLLASEVAIKEMVKKYFRGQNIGEVMREVDESYKKRKEEDKEEVLGEIEKGVDESSAPIVRLANSFIETAYKKGASDIHLEPTEKDMEVRYRVDGVLHKAHELPKHVERAMVARFKIMSNLDIAERRLPQDGRIKFSDFNPDIDIELRVSVIPVIFGEKIVMRLLDKSSTNIGLGKLGFSENNAKLYRWMITQAYGMVLHVGPTGSGKTTTLYAALTEINTPEVNIQTAEDPVEYILAGINQLHVKSDIGLTFAQALRSFLRQDPDIIMVGEIRDVETAQIAIEAALTGHLVFSTLHTNDAAGTITRLLDMGVEPFLVSSSILGVCAQRLLRRICDKCKESYEVKGKELEGFGFKEKKDKVVLYRGKGCDNCDNLGYRGRLGIHELLVMNDDIRHLILKRASATEIKEAAIKAGMITLYEDGLNKALKGITTVEEVLSVTRAD